MRVFPNMVVMAPGDELDVPGMLDFSLTHNGPVSIRYPKTGVESVERTVAPVELGVAEVWEWGHDGMLVAFGSLFGSCIQAAHRLRAEGLDVGVINARFVKPLDKETILRAVSDSGFVLTIEEGSLVGGFGSAVLEAANDAGLRTDHIRRLGIPDRYIDHAERHEQLAEMSLDVDGIVRTALAAAARGPLVKEEQSFS
jgi:1-deoxy-D-xylulose-5-phosphate synthase